MTNPVRDIVDRYLSALSSGLASAEIAQMFSVSVDYDVPGDSSVAWWVGRREGREGAARFYDEMRDALEPISFEIEVVLTEGEHAAVIGRFASRVRQTGKTFQSPFVMHFVIREGLIQKYLFLEDSAAARAAALDTDSRTAA